MASVAAKIQDKTDSKEFAALLEESLKGQENFTGSVVNGTIIAVTDDFAIVDVGLKSEGRIPLQEFSRPGEDAEIKTGDVVEVFVERMENRDGESVLSREKARREEAWIELEKASEKEERVTGVIFGRVKGGFTVDLGGAVAFLPGSQVDIRPVRDVSPLMDTPQPFLILKMDRARGNIVVSRRAILEESRAEARSDLMDNLKEGQVLQGVVKNITDYGAFVDLGGVDGLLHVTDISWKRVNHPSESLQVGQTIDVQVIRFNEENQRISLGMKQCQQNPWDEFDQTHAKGDRVSGKIKSITDFGIFIGLDGGIDGLVHLSDISWNAPGEEAVRQYKKGQEVEAVVLAVDPERERISLGIKQLDKDPFSNFVADHPKGSVTKGRILSVDAKGAVVDLGNGVEGTLRASELSRERVEDARTLLKEGEEIEAKFIGVDRKNRTISLSIKAKDMAEEAEVLQDYSRKSSTGATLGDIFKEQISAQQDDD